MVLDRAWKDFQVVGQRAPALRTRTLPIAPIAVNTKHCTCLADGSSQLDIGLKDETCIEANRTVGVREWQPLGIYFLVLTRPCEFNDEFTSTQVSSIMVSGNHFLVGVTSSIETN